MIDKRRQNADEAVAGIKDGSIVLIGGFGMTGEPRELCSALAARKVRGLTIVTNNAGSGEFGIGLLMKQGCVDKIVCSFPRVPGSVIFEELYESGKLELEIVPQGTIAERVRNLRDHGFEEGVSTRLLIYTGQLISQGITPRRAGELAITTAISDDRTVQDAVRDIIDVILP